MYPLTLAAIRDATGLPIPPGTEDTVVTGVEFDSRRVRPGTLFVALRGEHADGHDFADAVAAAGAVAILGSREIPDGAGSRVPLLRCPDQDAVLGRLRAIAAHSIDPLIRSGLVIVGVTGSSGKTSTKDLIAAVLRAGPAGPDAVVAPPESFNNEIGHPYTVLRADINTRYLVLELSARGIGHIASLASTARPRIGVVLNVGSAHLGEFGSVQAIAQAKGELVEALPAAADGGVAVLNADDPLVAAMATRTTASVVTTGIRSDADVSARDVAVGPAARARFTLVTPEGSAPVELQLVGAHQVANALSAAAVGRAVGVPVEAVATALSTAGPASKWRMAVAELPGGVTLINDAYNSNPESVGAALEALAVIGAGRRTWAVLGEMAELGPTAAQAHRAVGRRVGELGVRRLVVVGAAAGPILDGLREQPGTEGTDAKGVSGPEDALRLVLSGVRPADVVLVKASRSVGLERLAAMLAEQIPAAVAAHHHGDTAGDRPGRELA